jgi:hypothetical protein
MKKSHCYLIENLLLPLFDISEGEKKKVLDGVLDGFLAVSSCHYFGSLCKKERGETKLCDFLLYRANPTVERAKCFEFYLNTS